MPGGSTCDCSALQAQIDKIDEDASDLTDSLYRICNHLDVIGDTLLEITGDDDKGLECCISGETDASHSERDRMICIATSTTAFIPTFDVDAKCGLCPPEFPA